MLEQVLGVAVRDEEGDVVSRNRPSSKDDKRFGALGQETRKLTENSDP
jgi:hypothetical protein